MAFKAIFQLLIRLRFDSTTRRTRCLRFEYDTTSYEEPIRGVMRIRAIMNMSIFLCIAVRCCSQSARRKRYFCDDVIVTYNFSVYFSAHFRGFVSIYTVFIMNDPIKNLSSQDIENLIELYRLERCFILIVGQLRCWLSRCRYPPGRPAAYCYTELDRGITSGRPLARNYP